MEGKPCGPLLSHDWRLQNEPWLRENKILALVFDGLEYFPVYALNPLKGYLPHESFQEVVKIFYDHKSSKGVAFWFQSVNGYLNGAAPKDLIGTVPEQVIEAAKIE